ncbi:MAG: amidohydrolase [Acidimicrobiia bacterium]|nr:amidohydrolase [Acidimicrobiia bacterium]
MVDHRTAIDFEAFDADNHYYEAEDAFIRHVDPEMHKRCMQWADIGGRRRLLVAGRVNRFIPNPTFDPVARPGVLDQYFRAKTAVSDMRQAFGELEPISPAYRDRDARIALMDNQGLASAFLFPTLGVGMEAALEHDLEAMLAAFRGFNRWLVDDWGFAHRGRLFASAYLTLADPDWAIDELDWALANDVRVVNIRPTSVVDGASGRRSLGHPLHEPFWRRVNDSGVTVAMHSGDSGYGFMKTHWGRGAEFESFRYDPLAALLTFSPISDAIASLLAEGVLVANPHIRVATIETGSSWVRPLFEKLSKTYGQHRSAFAEDPCETFARQVFVSPYYEDDIGGLAGMVGTDHILFGSDYPHAEGLADPLSFVADLDGFDDAAVRAIMRDNGLALTTRAG